MVRVRRSPSTSHIIEAGMALLAMTVANAEVP